MKTIIKPGKKVYKAVCDVCGCEFTYQDEDEVKTSGLGDFGEAFQVFVDCPCCNNNIFLRGTK